MINLVDAKRLKVGQVVRSHGRSQLKHRYSLLAGLVDKLVIDVGDVDDPGHFKTGIDKVAFDRVEDHRANHMTDVCFGIDRWTTQVHSNSIRLDRLKRFFGLGQRVVNSNRVGGHVNFGLA